MALVLDNSEDILEEVMSDSAAAKTQEEGKVFVTELVKHSIMEEILANIRDNFDIPPSYILHTTSDLSRACSLRSN